MEKLKAPFPYFGGKSKISSIVWEKFGDVEYYIEPFFGSGAVLLGRPSPFNGIEIVNDLCGFVSNFWRAVQADPDSVVKYCETPVNEIDIHARSYWLYTEGKATLDKILGDPEKYDSKIAGWWCWGVCSSLGDNFLAKGPWKWDENEWKKTVNSGGIIRGIPKILCRNGINQKKSVEEIYNWFNLLSKRLRNVKVTCGDWSRVCAKSVINHRGKKAFFLDPPYSLEDRQIVYSNESKTLASEVCKWAIEAGKKPKILIALCGYDSHYDMPSDWEKLSWKAQGGYGNLSNKRGKVNRSRETIWFSPACLKETKSVLYEN